VSASPAPEVCVTNLSRRGRRQRLVVGVVLLGLAGALIALRLLGHVHHLWALAALWLVAGGLLGVLQVSAGT
jgi:hypothetical protein